MKTLAPTITISLAFYGVLLILILSISTGFDIVPNENANTDLSSKEMLIDFEEEEYIDDIPFDTKLIAKGHLQESK